MCLRPFQGLNMAVCIHLEAKTAYGPGLSAVRRLGSRYRRQPLSTQDAIAAALVEAGIQVFAWHGATAEECNDHIRNAH